MRPESHPRGLPPRWRRLCHRHAHPPRERRPRHDGHYRPGRPPLGSFTLAQPLDTALVDDRHVFHGVTPIEPKDPHQPAWRDVLVITWKADGAPGAPRM
ncbi:MAG: 2OG-Fe dioxygenase family protein [Planctomycetota bacterium]